MLQRLGQRLLGIVRRPRVRTATVLLADIAGSTYLYESVGDAQARELVASRLARMTDAIRREGGRVVKSLGDGILCVFDDPAQAVSAATAIALEDDVHDLKVRTGLHHGEIIVVGRDVFGDTVNTAARIADLAKANEVLVSRSVLDALPKGFDRLVRPVQPVTVKGKKEPLELFATIRFDDGSDSATIPVKGRDAAPATPSAAVRVSWRDRELRADGDRPRLTIGRAADNDLPIDCPNASRHHAVVEVLAGKAVLVDQSSNGTWIASADGWRLRVHRERTPLIGSGRIFLGSGPDDGDEGVGFEVRS